MPELLGAFILGAVQGITEFLPISSTAHLYLIPWLFGWQSPLLESLTFTVALHMGTLLAILTYFARDWLDLVTRSRRTFLLVVIGTIPAAVVGVLLEKQVETAFRSPLLIAITLIALGILLAFAERMGPKTWNVEHLTPVRAILIGLGQAAAIVPGVSRSGGTMTAALFLGMQREPAARFSFLLAAPIMLGAGLKKLPDMATSASTEAGLLAIAVGFLTSLVVGYLSIKFLLQYLQRNTLYLFVWYRIALGLTVLAVFAARGN